ncbi:MAG: DEAD/DEAH box helicase family protein [Acidobacteriia bacterium]|nr:DEAD/DEAH box helicase family protein [Terriglobia bacterium]
MAMLKEMVHKKSCLLQDLDEAKRQNKNREILNIASEAAALEGHIARNFILADRPDDAIVNLISEASCFKDAGRLIEARRVLEIALEFARGKRPGIWIQQELQRIPAAYANPSKVFQRADANITSNPNLRRPQREAYDAATRHFASSNEHAIIQLPVGCGKTGTISILPFQVAHGRMLAVAPNLEIRQNLLSALDYTSTNSFLKNRGVLSNGSGPSCAVLDEDANIVDCDEASIIVTNIQQLVAGQAGKWLAKLPPDFFDLIVLDEGHHNVAPSWKHTLAQFPDAKIASFTATPFRADGQKIEGNRIYRFPIADAIKEGYIKDLASHRLEPQELLFTYRGEKRRHSLEEVLKLKEEQWFSKGVALSPECNKSIVDHSLQCMEELRASGQAKHQIIAAACSIDHARAIRALYDERNYKAEVIHSNLLGDEPNRIRKALRSGEIDVIVHVQMLAEGADYPNLSVAAIFRPFRHLVPYVQFVGRVMRVIKQENPGDPDNRGYVVSHVGLNVDRWWEELKGLDQDDQAFFAALAGSDKSFVSPGQSRLAGGELEIPPRQRFLPEMVVLEEVIAGYVKERFLPEDIRAIADDVVNAMSLRGLDLNSLGIDRASLEERIRVQFAQGQAAGKVIEHPVQPQRARQVAKQRLDERVGSAAKQLLNELGLSVGGFDLPRIFPQTATTNNLAAAIVLLNLEIQAYLKVGSKERDILTTEQMIRAHDDMDKLVDSVAAKFREKKR